jgi:hypothetical protein
VNVEEGGGAGNYPTNAGVWASTGNRGLEITRLTPGNYPAFPGCGPRARRLFFTNTTTVDFRGLETAAFPPRLPTVFLLFFFCFVFSLRGLSPQGLTEVGVERWRAHPFGQAEPTALGVSPI